MHTRGYILCLTYLVAGDGTCIEYLEDEYGKTIRVNCGHRMTFDGVPSRFRNLRGSIIARRRR